MRAAAASVALWTALLAAAAAAPREHERVVYPPDGGLSRPIIGKKMPTTTTAPQAELQGNDDIEDEIDLYIQNPHNEKHIFRKKPTTEQTADSARNPVDQPSTTLVQEDNSEQGHEQFEQRPDKQEPNENVPRIPDKQDSTNKQQPETGYKPHEPNSETFAEEILAKPIPGNVQPNSPNNQETESAQYDLGLHQTNKTPEYSSDSKGNTNPQQNKESAAPESYYTPNKPTTQANSEFAPSSISGQKEQSIQTIDQAKPTVGKPETNYNINEQNFNKPPLPDNQPHDQQNQHDYNSNKEQQTHNEHGYDQNNNQKPDETIAQNQKPSELDNIDKHEEPQPSEDNETQVRYDGSQLWKIPIDEIYKIRLVNNLSLKHVITTWGGNRSFVDALIPPENLSNVSQALARSGIPYEVVITDLQKAIEDENPPLDEEQLELQNRKGHRLTWVQYHRIQDIHGFLDYLATTYPQICRVQSIGKSYEGRDLKLLKISNGQPNNKAVFIDGGIHAREWIAPATVTYIINHIVENYDNGPEIYRNLDWYFLPLVNPDGYEYTHSVNRLWRKNRSGYGVCPGVDLNRNFGFKWGGKGTSSSPCSDVYRGPNAFSEPESRAIRDFILGAKANFKLYASYHSYGQFILYPWGYEEISPVDDYDLKTAGNNAAEAIRRLDSTYYTVGTSSKVLYASAGGSDDWAKAIPGIKYSYTIELPDTGKHGFVLPARYILRVGKESVKGLEKLAEAAASA